MGCLVSWKSCGQKNATLPLTKAKYIVISELCAELLFVRRILNFLGKKIDYPIILCWNNVGAIFLAHNTKTSHRTKHIDTRYHFVCKYVEDNMLKIMFVKSAENHANPYTKNVGEESFKKNAEVYQEWCTRPKNLEKNHRKGFRNMSFYSNFLRWGVNSTWFLQENISRENSTVKDMNIIATWLYT